jgi:hypothetical protein
MPNKYIAMLGGCLMCCAVQLMNTLRTAPDADMVWTAFGGTHIARCCNAAEDIVATYVNKLGDAHIHQKSSLRMYIIADGWI